MNYKKEFYRLKELIQSPDIRIIIYKKKNYFKYRYASGYVYLLEQPKKIFIAGKGAYTKLICRLLHEYGHVLDYEQWKDTARWALYIQFLTDNIPFGAKVSIKMKRAILWSEFLADEQAKRTVKRFNSTYPIEQINKHQFMNVALQNFEITYGKDAPQEVGNLFFDNVQQGMTKATFMDLPF